jgi:hypothetical protein
MNSIKQKPLPKGSAILAMRPHSWPPFVGLYFSLELSPGSLSLLNRCVYILYDEVEVHRGPMPLIVAMLRTVYRGAAARGLGQ